MPPLLSPTLPWKPILCCLLLSFSFLTTGVAFNGEYEKTIESGKEALKGGNGAAARINFKKAWDNAGFTQAQRDAAKQLYYKAKNLDPYFNLLKEATGHIGLKNYKLAVSTLESGEKHLFSSATRFPDATLDGYFSEELETLIVQTEEKRLEVVTDGRKRVEQALKTDPSKAKEILDEISNQMVDSELAEYQIGFQQKEIEVDISYKKYLDDGKAAMANKDYAAAKEAFVKGFEIKSSEEIYQLIQESEKLLCLSFLEKSKREMELKNFEYGLELLEESVTCTDPDELASIQKMAQENLYKEYLVQGSRALEQENFQVAWSTLKKARRNKITSEVDALISKAEKGAKYENYLQIGLDYENDGEWKQALEAYNEANSQLQKPEIAERLATTKDIISRTDEKIKLAETAMKDAKWELARTHLLAGQKIYPKSNDIKRLLQKIEDEIAREDEDSK